MTRVDRLATPLAPAAPVAIDLTGVTSRAKGVSIVVPTYKEAENIRELVERVERAMEGLGEFEIVIVDDNSADGTDEVVASLARGWVRLHVRTEERGLSSAVLAGLARARFDTLVVMDADLSHPPEAVPAMVERIAQGADFVVGSRYVKGGSTDAAWSVYRHVNSRVATLMARPFTRLRDPMSGFFALRAEDYLATRDLSPVGYKIALELLVKGPFVRVVEVPIHFADRKRGTSKLGLREQALYLKHIARLAAWKAGGGRRRGAERG